MAGLLGQGRGDYWQNLASQQQVLENIQKIGAAKKMVDILGKQGMTPQQQMTQLTPVMARISPQTAYGNVYQQQVLEQQKMKEQQVLEQQKLKLEEEKKQQEFLNFYKLNQPMLNQMVKRGDTKQINEFFENIAEAYPQYSEMMAKVPEGLKIGTSANGDDIHVYRANRYDDKGNIIGEKLEGRTKQEIYDLTKSGKSPDVFFETTQQVQERDTRMMQRQLSMALKEADVTQKPKTVEIGYGDDAITVTVPPRAEKQIPAETQVKEDIKEQKKLRQEYRAAVRSPEYQKAKQGLNSIDQALNMIEDDRYIYRDWIEKKLGRGDAAIFNTAIRNAEDILTRIRTGAALNKEEVKFYDSLFTPGWFNDPDTAIKKMKMLKELFLSTLELEIDPESEIERLPSIAKKYGLKDDSSSQVVSDDLMKAFESFQSGGK